MTDQASFEDRLRGQIEAYHEAALVYAAVKLGLAGQAGGGRPRRARSLPRRSACRPRTSFVSCAGCALSAFARSCLTVRSRSRREANRCARARPRGLPKKSRSWSGNIGGLGPMSSPISRTASRPSSRLSACASPTGARRTPSKAPCSSPIWRRRRWRKPVPSSRLWIYRARSASPISAAAMAGCSPPCSAPIRGSKRCCSTARTSSRPRGPSSRRLGSLGA